MKNNQPKAPKAYWIRPSELFPPVGELVLVCHKCNPSSVMTYTLLLGAEESFRRNIACWSPLPEPPKQPEQA